MFLNKDRLPYGQLEHIDCQKGGVYTDIENSIYHSDTDLLPVSP
jgi:hypothetical protein